MLLRLRSSASLREERRDPEPSNTLTDEHSVHGRRGRTFATIAALLALIAIVLWLTVTSPQPLLPMSPAPTAEQVGAGRDAYRQLREARGKKGGTPLVLGSAQLDGLGVVASHGFRPDRLTLSTDGSVLVVEASHHLPLGRWLNVTLRAESPSSEFPRTHLKLGAWSLPPLLSRWALEAARWVLERRVQVPPLDAMVRNFSVDGGTVRALVSLPAKSGLVDQMATAVAQPIDGDEVVRIYCALTNRQRQEPSSDFAEQVHRAFSLDPQLASRADFNRAAFIALGILLVDQRVAHFARLSPEDLGRCRIATVATSIYERSDWPKHWMLSAAISVGAGVQLSEAAGEWKELADSLARQSQFAVGDPSGFSMADLAADRAGFQAATAAVQPDSAERLAGDLANATPQQLLPHALIEREDGLTNAEFVRRYGGVDDPRFKARVQEIDAALAKSGLR
jgi:hypothetical protein